MKSKLKCVKLLGRKTLFNGTENVHDRRNEKLKKSFEKKSNLCTETTLLGENNQNVHVTYIWVISVFFYGINL